MQGALRRLRNALPFKRALYHGLRAIWTPQESVYRHLHFEGPFSVATASGRRFRLQHAGFQIENEIFWRGLGCGWESVSLTLWQRLCEGASGILDVGANTGVYALVAKTQNPTSTVIAVEPHATFYAVLQENIRLNGYEITALQVAISDRTGTVTIGDYAQAGGELRCPCMTLDALVEQHGLPAVDLLKVDVEGHEPKLLHGARDTLHRFRPTLLIEVLTPTTAAALNEALDGLGYLFFNVDERSGIRQTTRAEVSDYYNCLACQPSVAERLGLADAAPDRAQ